MLAVPHGDPDRGYGSDRARSMPTCGLSFAGSCGRAWPSSTSWPPSNHAVTSPDAGRRRRRAGVRSAGADDLRSAVVGRDGWILTGAVAGLGAASGWTAKVRAVPDACRAGESWHAAILDAAGTARYGRLCYTPAEGVGWAERSIRALERGTQPPAR